MTETSVRGSDYVADYARAVEESNDNVAFRLSTERPRRGVIVISVFGDLDMVTVPRFTEIVQQRVDSSAPVIVLDLTGVTFLGVEAIKMLAQLDLRAHLSGKRLSLVTGVRAVDRPLEALGLAARFTYGSRPVFEPATERAELVRPRRSPQPQSQSRPQSQPPRPRAGEDRAAMSR
ncbi:STAS domain-containing protein [Actinopolyspora saharensis]|uniref:Anti-anti-sigma factor n=1 Tax=Actinopolyspora saharensis TaxID=995062 RepID=A0A1H1GGT6_9ACTN|nr:STAS domain-containing protein [Actinopolyspora saharensis]SDR12522.1 anti-anti-sigma factor [Actinopolyspora saharensis]